MSTSNLTFRIATSDTFNFSQALDLIKSGNLMQRINWDGVGVFIFKVDGSTFNVNRKPLNVIFPEGTEVNYHHHIDMHTKNGQIVPWVATQEDLFADDWVVVEAPVA